MASGGILLDEDTIRSYNKVLIRRVPGESAAVNSEYDISKRQEFLLNVMRTGEEVRISNSHRAATTDALCGLLKTGLTSPEGQWSRFCGSPDIWKRLLSIYFDRSNDASAKPMKQILDTLMFLLHYQRSASKPNFIACSEYALSICIRTLLDSSASGSCRPSMLVLDRLLSDRYITRDQIISVMRTTDGKLLKTQFATDDERFVYRVLLWTGNSDLARVSGKLLSSFCASEMQADRSREETGKKALSDCWSQPLSAVLQEYPEIIGTLEQHILPNLLRVDKDNSIAFSHKLPLRNLWKGDTVLLAETDIRLSLMLLRANDELKLDLFKDIATISVPHKNETGGRLSFVEKILTNLLTHRDSEIKLSALFLLTSQRQTTRPINPAVVLHLGTSIAEFFGETEAKIRNDFLALMKRLFTRFEAMAWRLEKLGIRAREAYGSDFWGDLFENGENNTEAWLLANVSFLQTYQFLILSELSPTASFQRHILALKALSYLRALHLPESFSERLERDAQRSLQPLLNLIMDPFEDVRATSAKLAASHHPDMTLMSDAMRNAENLMRTSGRADHADGFGRLIEVNEAWKVKESSKEAVQTELPVPGFNHYEVSSRFAKSQRKAMSSYVSLIESFVANAESDLRGSIADAPLHGNMIALRYLIDSSKSNKALWLIGKETATLDPMDGEVLFCKDSPESFCKRVQTVCERIWKVVYPILCDDSPEGTDFFNTEEDDIIDVGLKDTLSYAWRALKESSLLVQSMLKMAETTSIIESVDINQLGNLLFAQLAQLRHRGAFSSVAQTFSSFCSFCVRKPNSGGDVMIETIYIKTLDCVLEKGNALTRRSAGLPALIVGLLSADLGGPLMNRVFDDLKAISQRPAESENAIGLPQVHALNCLKDIFLSARLGPETESHLSEVLSIAVNCLDNSIWAIRNSGLMLLKALFVRLEEGRINSNTKYQTASRSVFQKSVYAKHPALLGIVLNLLRASVETVKSSEGPNIHNQLIEKTFPAIDIIERVGVPAAVEKEVKELLAFHLRSSVWAMRNKAAGCLALLSSSEDVIEYLDTTVDEAKQNSLHGALLLLRHFLRERSSISQISNVSKYVEINYQKLEAGSLCFANQDILHENMLTLSTLATGGLERVEMPSVEKTYQNSLFSSFREFDLTNFNSSEGLVLESKVHLWMASYCVHGIGYQRLCDLLPLGTKALASGLRALRFQKQTNEQDIRSILQISLQMQNTEDIDLMRSMVCSLNNAVLSFIKDQVGPGAVTIFRQLTKIGIHLACRPVNQAVLNELIKFWGTLVAISLFQDEGENKEENSRRWLSLLESAMKEEMDADVRQAAMDSVQGFREIVSSRGAKASMTSEMLRLALVIYDGTTDDDDDIRNDAASLASWFIPWVVDRSGCTTYALSEGTPALSPSAARQNILRLFPQLFGSTRLLPYEALIRITRERPENFMATSFSQQLEFAEKKSTTLFDIEKQNQFIDETKEAEDWIFILSHIPEETMTLVPLKAIRAWVSDGAEYLVSLLQRRSPATLTDPIGTLCQPDAFLLCKRLLLLTTWILMKVKELEPSSSSDSLHSKALLLAQFLDKPQGDSSRSNNRLHSIQLSSRDLRLHVSSRESWSSPMDG